MFPPPAVTAMYLKSVFKSDDTDAGVGISGRSFDKFSTKLEPKVEDLAIYSFSLIY